MDKKEYQKRIQDRLLKVTIQRLEDQIQCIFDLIGDLQKGRIDAEDIPECYKESEAEITGDRDTDALLEDEKVAQENDWEMGTDELALREMDEDENARQNNEL